jgi:hypothetical protein
VFIRGKAVAFAVLTSGQRLSDVDLAVARHWIAEMLAVPNLASVDEYDHMGAHRSLLIEDVGPSLWVSPKHGVEGLPHRLAFDTRRRAADMALEVWCEGYSRHHKNREREEKRLIEISVPT